MECGNICFECQDRRVWLCASDNDPEEKEKWVQEGEGERKQVFEGVGERESGAQVGRWPN